MVAVRLGFVSKDLAAAVLTVAEEVGRLLTGLLRSVTGN